jgi:mannose-6-phosphate isomerase-like protein (cupin superfamily)
MPFRQELNMEVTRFNQAKPYQAPGHFDMCGLRLQGWDVSGAQHFWVGYSQFLPGGGAEMDASSMEKVYVVMAGEITIILESGKETVLGPKDSCFIGPHESREIVNRGNETASMLVVMSYPEPES